MRCASRLCAISPGYCSARICCASNHQWGCSPAFETSGELAATIAWLHALDADPTGLQRDIAAARLTRLGRYAECLLAWFLQHGPTARLIAANVPLRRAGLTLGECDFLVQTQAGRRLHWELAVKCYLHAGDSRAQLADYVGPNLQDRFDLKLSHLLDHQLPLSARVEFASLGHVGPWEPQMFIKGWLFYPLGRAGRRARGNRSGPRTWLVDDAHGLAGFRGRPCAGVAGFAAARVARAAQA
jgi:hypothetical protein